MEKIKKSYKIILSYVFVVFSVIFVILSMMNTYDDLYDRAWKDAEEKHLSNAEMLSRYCDELLENRINALGLLADRMKGVDLKSMSSVASAIKQQASLFDGITIVSTDGGTLFGEALSGNIQQSSCFQRALEGNNLLDEVSYMTEDKRTELRFYAPIMKENKVEMVLVGRLMENTLSGQLTMLSKNQGGCVFLVGEHGKYVTTGASYRFMFGQPKENFYRFLKDCDIQEADTGTVLHSDDIRRMILSQKQQVLIMDYSKARYIATFIPLENNNWYMVSAIRGSSVKVTDSVMSQKNLNMLYLMVIDLIFVFLMLAYLVGREGAERRILNRYQLIAGTEKALYFEYTFNPKYIEVFCNTCQTLAGCPKVFIGEAVYDIYDSLHEDDAGLRGRLSDFFEGEDTVFSTEVRIRGVDGTYEWHRVSGRKILDKNKEGERFVGKITNVSKEVNKSRDLIDQAENDLLTGVLNKKTMEAKVSAMLQQKRANRHYIFFMVDLDNFKSVNDELGHIYGDNAIADTAGELSMVFQHNALVGRLGGDEFAVCAYYDAFDEQSLNTFIVEKAEKICEVNRRSYTDGINEVRITSSVGIAVAPELGATFQVVYERADKALYESKNTGKDKYTLFENV